MGGVAGLTVTLRDYQSALVGGVHDVWAKGERNALAVLATGGGKSVCLSHIISEHNGASCVIAHRQELVSQLSMHLGRWGVKHRIIAPKAVVRRCMAEHRRELGRSWVDPDARASVAGVDTLVSKTRAPLLAAWAQQVSLWVIDEAAHVLRSNKWGVAAAMFPNARGLGVTATPTRADGQGLGAHASGVFDRMVIGPDTRELIRRKALTDYEVVLPASDIDLSGVAITGSGDFSPKGLRAAAEKSHIIGDVVENYQRFANGSQAVVFATDVKTAERMAASFVASGIPAAAVSGETQDAERARAVQQFRDGVLRVLVNVDLFDEGFDLPAIETVIMARPTWSLAKYLQMIGRGLRLMPGKDRALIIDHVSNVKRHGLPDAPRTWSLDDREKRSRNKPDPDVIPVTHCEKCLHAYERVRVSCPHCGHTPEPVGRSAPEMVDGDLMLLDRDALDKLRGAAELDPPEIVAARARYAGGEVAARGASARQRERIEAQGLLTDAIAHWAGHGRSLGYSDRELHKLFYLRYNMTVLEALALKRVDMDKLTDVLYRDAYVTK